MFTGLTSEFKKSFKNDWFLQRHDAVFQGRVPACCTPIPHPILLSPAQLHVCTGTHFNNTRRVGCKRKTCSRKQEISVSAPMCSSFMTSVKSVNITLIKLVHDSTMSSAAQVRMCPLPRTATPLTHYPILFTLTMKYTPKESTSLLLCLLSCNPCFHDFSLDQASYPVSFPTSTMNPHPSLLHTTSRNLCTVHRHITPSSSFRVLVGFLLLFGKMAQIANIQNL